MTEEKEMPRQNKAHRNLSPSSRARRSLSAWSQEASLSPGPSKDTIPMRSCSRRPKGQLLVFKHAIATIEAVDEPKGYKPDV